MTSGDRVVCVAARRVLRFEAPSGGRARGPVPVGAWVAGGETMDRVGSLLQGGGARTVDGEVDEKVHAVLDGGVEGSIRAQRLEEIHEVVRQGHMQLPPQRAQDTQLQVLELVRACIAVVNLFEFREWRQLAVEKLGSDEQASRRDHLNVWPLAAFADVRRQLRRRDDTGGQNENQRFISGAAEGALHWRRANATGRGVQKGGSQGAGRCGPAAAGTAGRCVR